VANFVRPGDIIRVKDTQELWQIDKVATVASRTKVYLYNGDRPHISVNAVDVDVVKKAGIRYVNWAVSLYVVVETIAAVVLGGAAGWYLHQQGVSNFLWPLMSLSLAGTATVVLESPLKWAQRHTVR
jgi:hypothetical protein